MSKISLSSNPSGNGIFTIASPNSNTNRTLTLPDATGTVNVSGLANEVPAGSAGAPAIYPTGDTNTGIFFPAADTIAFAEGGVESMRLDSGGRLTVPNQPTFWAWNGQGSTTGLTSNALLTFSSTDLNIGGNYSTATGRFTAPVAGVYQFNCMVLFRASSSTNPSELTFYKNGTNIATRNLAYVSASGSDHIPMHTQTFLSLAAGDYVQPYALVSSGVNLYLIERLSWFCGRLVS